MTGAPRRAARDGGFTLLETLAALAILSVVLAVIPRPLVQARTTLTQSDDWLRARLVADAVLADQLRGPNLAPGTLTGSLDGIAWTARLSPSPMSRPESGWALLSVSLDVTVPNGPTLTAATLRTGRAQPQ